MGSVSSKHEARKRHEGSVEMWWTKTIRARVAAPMVGAALLAALLPTVVRATDDPLVVTTDTTPTKDHNGGIVIAADDVTLDCDGYSVQGGGTGIGILIEGRMGVTVTGCVVTAFSEGIVLENGSHNTITENALRQNEMHGMRLSSSGSNEITGNRITESGFGPIETGIGANGLILHEDSSSNRVTFNIVENTDSTGFVIVDSGFKTIIANVSSRNGDRGFDVINASTNTLSRNIVVDNGDTGIHLRGGSELNVVRNNAACLNDPVDAADEQAVDGGKGNTWVNNLFCSASV
jgi:parallel beta-helix repeat protein